LVNSIRSDNFIVVAELDNISLLCMKRLKKVEQTLILPLQGDDDYDKIINVLKNQSFGSVNSIVS